MINRFPGASSFTGRGIRSFAHNLLPTMPYSWSIRKRTLAFPLLCTVSLGLMLHMYFIMNYPPQLVPRAEYLPVLESALPFFPSSMRLQLGQSLHRVRDAMSGLDDGSSSLTQGLGDISLIQNRVWQTDRSRTTNSDTATWVEQGFERIFLDDEAAIIWVNDTFGDSDISRTYSALPKPVMKADMLRYLLLLAAGGVYSDMDTRALMPLARWAEGGEVFRSTHRAPSLTTDRRPLRAAGPGTTRRWDDANDQVSVKPQPIRFVLGVEGDFHIWRDKVMMAEGMGLTKSGRHRGLQFAQWTLAAAPHHPILLDTVRRIVDTGTLARAWEISQTRSIQALEAKGWREEAAMERTREAPWEHDVKGEALSVQEWTGPAVFTDAVLSYLLAVAGVQEEDLYRLDRPVQIADVLVLPIDGFHPTRASLPHNPVARVAHMFRGSWKDPWPFHLDKIKMMDLAGAGSPGE